MEKLRLIQLQLALFFEDVENRPDKFVSRMSEVSDNIFNQMPTILPIPIEAPPEIPVVIMNSEDNLYTCNIAKSRIDFIANLSNYSDQSINDQLDNFLRIIRPYAAIVFGYKNIVRFGLVGQYFYKTDNSINEIKDKYINTNLKDLKDLEELSIRYNMRCNSNSLQLNNIVELGKGVFQQNINNNISNQDGMSILRDINNVSIDKALVIEDVFLVIKSKLPELKSSGIIGILK